MFLKPKCTTRFDGLWLGLSDITAEGTFIWENSGKPLTYTKWTDGKPDDFGQREDCVHMWCPNENGEWNDWHCDETVEPPQTTLCEVICPCQ